MLLPIRVLLTCRFVELRCSRYGCANDAVSGVKLALLLNLLLSGFGSYVSAILYFTRGQYANIVVFTKQLKQGFVGQVFRIENPALLVGFPHQHFLDLQKQSWLLAQQFNDLVRGERDPLLCLLLGARLSHR